jgi:hypothetical protein
MVMEIRSIPICSYALTLHRRNACPSNTIDTAAMPKHFHPSPLAKALAVSGIACAMGFGTVVQAQTAPSTPAAPATKRAAPITTAELARKLEALERQNAALQAKVEKLEAAQAQQTAQTQQAPKMPPMAAQMPPTASAVPQAAPAVATAIAAAPPAAALPAQRSLLSSWADSTTVSAYGEIGYSHPTKAPQDTNVDVQRAVIGMQHRFDDKTKMVAEWEWEHAITSADDRGESEVEQLWLEREFDNGLRGRAGLFLMPVGLLNQNHEPTAYYGVYRPDVDTKIIPSTWREAGLGLSGDTQYGLNWDVALTTAPNLSNWDPSSTEGRDRGPLQAIHGEGQFAIARDLGVVGALNYRGVPGLWIGSSVVYDSIGQGQPGFLGDGAKLLMVEGHARYQIAGWDLAGEFARGTISNTEALNASYAAGSIVDPTLVPKVFYGGYVQAAYSLWHRNDYTLVPFVRYEVLNTAAGFGDLPAADGGIKAPTERIWTLGASFRIGEGVVLKADYRGYKQNKLPDPVDHFNLGNSVNLGVGFAF